jgi:signal transduction histidine kinase/CheY-like chemotaxis protein
VTTEADVRAEQVKTLYQQGPTILSAHVGIALIVSAVLWGSVPTPELLALPGCLVVLGVLRLVLGRRYFRAKPSAAETATWARRFVVGSACSGLVWGVAGFWFFGRGGALAELVIPLAIGGMSAAAAGTISNYLPAFFAFIVPALSGVLTRSLLLGDAQHLALAAMIAVFGPALSSIALVTHRALLTAFRLRFQNDALLRELSSAREHLEESNRTLEERVAERSRELEKNADALRDAQRMEAVGRLAGGVAHDFNNLLMVVLGNVNELIAAEKGSRLPSARLGEIRDAASRGAELVKQLLLFSRRENARPETLDLNHVVTAMQRLLGRLIGEHLTLEVKLSNTPIFVRLDPSQLEQVVINLVTNARDAMARGGTVTVETARVDLEHPDDGLAPGSYARLVVADTGIGMDPETQKHLFEPFFTTKSVGQGTGLGLATVYGIVEQCGGAIRIRSKSREGSTFSIYFPRAEPTDVIRTSSPPSSRTVGGDVTILLVEDDPAVRAVTERMLSRAGHRVFVADSPERALVLAAEHAQHIELLVSDVVMPKMSGPDLAERVRDLSPGVRTLFMSGYNRGHLVPPEDEAKGIGFLEKPFTYAALTRKVAALCRP